MLENYSNWLLWLPVGIGIGICLYFDLNFEPSIYFIYSLAASLIICLILLYIMFFCTAHSVPKIFNFFTQKAGIFYLGFVLSVGVGFLAIATKAKYLNVTMLQKKLSKVHIKATVEGVEHLDYTKTFKRRMILKNITYDTSHSNNTTSKLPKKIRITVPKAFPEVKPGDMIESIIDLWPLPERASLRGFDFKRHAYFQGFGAIGKAHTEFKQHSAVNGVVKLTLARLQNYISCKIRQIVGGDEGQIAVALIVGEKLAIPSDIRQNFAKAGIAHLLAISGFHLSIVASLVFLFTRRILGLLVHYQDVKKISAFCVIVVTLMYVALSGFGFPALRAFIMVGLAMVAIITNRLTNTLYFVTNAATAILLMYPESLLSVSFQLSFAAVFGLIIFYEKLFKRLNFFIKHNFVVALFKYVLGVITSTIIATIFTLPIIWVTFNTFSMQAIIGNVIAIPYMSFIIAPFGIVAHIFYLFGVTSAIKLWKLSLGYLIKFANYVSTLPGTDITLATPKSYFLPAATLGILWLTLWHHKNFSSKLPGFLLLVVAILNCDSNNYLQRLADKPKDYFKVYIAANGSTMAYTKIGNLKSKAQPNKCTKALYDALYVSNLAQGKFYYNQWAKEQGITKIYKWPTDNITIYNAILISDPYNQFANLKLNNSNYKLYISNGYIKRYLKHGAYLIDRYSLKKYGSVEVFINNNSYKIHYRLKQAYNKRPWDG